jgi:hypothetical protein
VIFFDQIAGPAKGDPSGFPPLGSFLFLSLSKSGHQAALNVAAANQHLFLLETENISDQVIRLIAFDYEIRHIVVV